MKTLLKLGNITIGEVSVSDITIEQEYTAKDAVELAFNGKNFVKQLIKELPEVMEDLYAAAVKFNELDKKAEKELDWEITSVTHSVVKAEPTEDYQLSKFRVKVHNYVNNRVGNINNLLDELNIHMSDCTNLFVMREISFEEYMEKSKALDALRDMLANTTCSF